MGHDAHTRPDPDHVHPHGHGHDDGGHGHTHGLVDPSISRSREGVRVVGWSLLVLLATAAVQAAIFATSGSVALFADLVHNFGDALTALPLGAAFLLRSWPAERAAGFFVVAAILVSAVVAGVESVDRLVHPQHIAGLWALALAGVIGFLGNEAAAVLRLRGGRRLHSAALIADGQHARVDGLVSLGVVVSAAILALGWNAADPVVGLIITAIILHVTWQSFRTVLHARAPHD